MALQDLLDCCAGPLRNNLEKYTRVAAFYQTRHPAEHPVLGPLDINFSHVDVLGLRDEIVDPTDFYIKRCSGQIRIDRLLQAPHCRVGRQIERGMSPFFRNSTLYDSALVRIAVEFQIAADSLA